MCYNCGCHMPDNTMGKAENIINKDFEAAGKAMGMTTKEAMEETHRLLGMVLGTTPHHIVKNGEFDEYVEDPAHEHSHSHEHGHEHGDGHEHPH